MKSPIGPTALIRQLAVPIAIGLAAVVSLLAATHTVRADMAPLPAESGTSLGTAGTTDIHMISETVLIEVTDKVVTYSTDVVYTQTATRVTADFLLDNPQAAPQSLQVGFPLEIPAQATQSGGDFDKIKDLRAFVGNVEAETSLVTIGQETWSAWQMTFAPGANYVRVTYDLPVTEDACNAEIGYVLHTGAAWAGPIGQADLIVRYPYAAEATFVSPKGYYLAGPTPGYRVEGTDLRWHYDNLEPTAADDLALTFVAPVCWLPVAAARAAVIQHATAENYWNLADAYADVVFPHHGFYSPLIAQVAEAQYQKALALDAHNPQINAAYAQFLQTQVGGLLPASRLADVDQQCMRALLLAPQDAELLYACVPVLNSMIGDPNVSAGAQATAAAVLTVAPLPTFPVHATETAVRPSATPTVIASPSPQPTGSPTPREATMTPVEPSATASVGRLASDTPLAVAQVTATVAPSPAPPAQPRSNFPWATALIGLAVLVLVAGGAYYWRRRSTPA